MEEQRAKLLDRPTGENSVALRVVPKEMLMVEMKSVLSAEWWAERKVKKKGNRRVADSDDC
jgi:hypothetical protein